MGIRPPIEDFDVTGGRPGPVIESEAELARKEEIFQEIEDGAREYPSWFKEYGERDEDLLDDDDDDPDAIDARTLGRWDIFDLKSKFDYELDPSKGDPDPNALDENKRYVSEIPVDEDGIEIGWDPIFGSSNPIDDRTIVGTVDSYVVDEETRNITMVTPQFHPGDLEEELTEEVRQFRKSLDIIETYIDPYLPKDLEIPRHKARWYGEPERLSYPERNYTNNRFTRDEDLIDFDAMEPYQARKLAVQLARSKNAPWLRPEVSQEYHRSKRAPYEAVGTIVGTLREGPKDPALVERIQPALKILGSSAKLLSIEGDAQRIFRFHYYGLMKNKYGMECWTETLIRDCGVECDNVIFETGWRRRDHAHDGGFDMHGPC